MYEVKIWPLEFHSKLNSSFYKVQNLGWVSLLSFAEFERNRIRERTKEGLERAKAQGKKLGRPQAQSTTIAVQYKKSQGLSQSRVAEALGMGIATVKRHWNKAPFPVSG